MMNYPYPTGSVEMPSGMPVYPSFPGTAPQTAPSGAVYPPTPYSGAFPPTPSGMMIPGPGKTGSVPTPAGQLPIEESYIENILRLNLGKIATIYMTFENNSEWNAKVFKGKLEAAGRDHIIISDPATGRRYLLLMVNLDYITFDEPLNYYYPFSGSATVPAAPGR